MATLRRITVSNAAGFNPPGLQALAGDAVTWHNDDATAIHQPYPVGGKPGDWVPPITGGNSSQQFNLGVPGSFTYLDANNPALKGNLVVANLVQIGPVFGGGGAAFVPTPAGINVGTKVVWQNSDSVPHQPYPVGGSRNAWFAQPIAPGAYSSPVPFNAVGNFNYADALQPSLTGVIQVTVTTVTVGSNGATPPVIVFATPASVTVGYAVTFQNTDTKPHQPAPAGGPANAWFASPIAAGASANTPVFNTIGNVAYRDALNPALTGVLQVVGK